MGIFRTSKSLLKAAAVGDAREVNECLNQNSINWIDKDARDATGMTPLNLAAKGGHLPVIDLLTGKSADLEIADNSGHTPLLTAVMGQHREAALRLLRAGANANAHEDKYIYPLHMAAYNGDVDVVRALIDKGADVNAVILANGRTALHWATEKENTAAIEALVKAGARGDIADKSGKLPRDLVKGKANARYLLKTLGEDVPPAKAAPDNAATATIPANDVDAEAVSEPADAWTKSGAQRLTHTGLYPDINRRITEIFNFETRERTVISENLKSGAETLTAPESFDNVTEEALKKALSEFQRLGGTADEAAVMGARAGKKMFKL